MAKRKILPVSVVTGGAGFLGSHLVDLLLGRGHRVIAIDNLVTGSDELDQLVLNNADDKTVTHKLSALHDTFHTIVGLCRH